MLPAAEVSTLGPLLTSPQLHEPPPSAVREPLVATACLHLYPHPRPDHESMTLTQAAEYWHALRELTLMHACELWAVRLFGPATLEEELRRVLHQLS